MVLMPIKRVEELLTEERFIRVHKSYIISADKVTLVEKDKLFISSVAIPVSRSNRSKTFASIVSEKLWKK